MKPFTRFASILLLAGFAAVPASATEDRDVLQARVKSALNEMVQDVKAAEAPAEKREVLDEFLGKVEKRAEWAQSLPFVGEENRAVLAKLHDRFAGHRAELAGANGGAPVADADLDAFASFVQNDLEQADEVAWGNGGVYLSVGAIIIILLILVLVT